MGAVVVVKWSVCSPFTPTIRVRILLTSIVFSVKFVFEMNENKQNKAHLKNVTITLTLISAIFEMSSARFSVSVSRSFKYLMILSWLLT